MRYPKQKFSQYLNSRQRGSAAIEMALLLPILILMVVGVVEFGLLMHNQSVVTSASSVAARAGMAQGSPKLSNTQIAKIASDYCTGNLMAFSSAPNVSVDVLQASEPVFQKPLQVTVQFTYQGLLVGTFLSALQMNPQLIATTVMYNE